jgi:hypothetical protein
MLAQQHRFKKTSTYFCLGVLAGLLPVLGCSSEEVEPKFLASPAGAAGVGGVSGTGGAGGLAGAGGTGGMGGAQEPKFAKLEVLPVDATAEGARVRTVATAVKSDKALVVYEKKLGGGGAGLYATIFDGKAFGPPTRLVEGEAPTRVVWAEFLPLSEKAVIAFDRADAGGAIEVFASFFDGQAFSTPSAVSPAARPAGADKGPNDTYWGPFDSVRLFASRTTDAAALVLRWPSATGEGGTLKDHGWVLPVGPEGLGTLTRLDNALGEGFGSLKPEVPQVAFLPSGAMLFCQGGFTQEDVPAAKRQGAALCMPHVNGAFGEPTVLRPSMSGLASNLDAEGFNVRLAVSEAEERALLVFGVSNYPGFSQSELHAARYTDGTFGPTTSIARLVNQSQAIFDRDGNAFVAYTRFESDGDELAHTTGVAVVGGLASTFFELPSDNYLTCGFRSPLLQMSPESGGLLAFGVSNDSSGRCDLRASWYNNGVFAELAGLPEGVHGVTLKPLPRSPRFLGTFERLDTPNPNRLFGITISPDGGTLEVELGRLRNNPNPFVVDDDLRIFTAPTSDRALVVTPGPLSTSFEINPSIADFPTSAVEAVEASASLFDGTTFTPLARVGKCAYAAVLGASGRFLLACDEGGVTAKLIE